MVFKGTPAWEQRARDFTVVYFPDCDIIKCMTGIPTYKDLEAEKENLEASLRFHKRLIQADLAGLREELRPLKHALSLIGKLTTKDKSNPAIVVGVDLAGDALIKKGVLKKSGWLTKLIVPFVVKNYATHLLARKSNNFFQRLGEKLKSQ